MQAAVGARGATLEGTRYNILLVVGLRWVRLRAVELQSVVEASCVSFVDLVAHGCVAATRDSSPHSIRTVTCARDPVCLSGMVRLPRLRPVFEVRDLEVGPFLVPYLLCLGCSAHVGFYDVAIGLVL